MAFVLPAIGILCLAFGGLYGFGIFVAVLFILFLLVMGLEQL